ncbi:hypothetical protein LCGC14_2638950, partial [marine sediment metagenome]
ELTQSLQYAFEREKEIAKGLWASKRDDRKLLNTILPTGVAPKSAIDLPYYDIAFLIALGFSLEEVHRIITTSFRNIIIGLQAFQKRIRRVIGDLAISQAKFLKPVIESIIDNMPAEFLDVPSGIALTKVFMDFSDPHSTGWLSRWLKGEILLDTDFKRIFGNIDVTAKGAVLKTIKEKINIYYRRYFGATWRQWESWLIKGLSTRDIAKELNAPLSRVTKVFLDLGTKSLSAYRRVARRNVFIDLMALGISPKDIYIKTFKYSKEFFKGTEMVKRIEDLFDNAMTYDEIINYDWTSQLGGWIEFYGLIRGEDY